jgi:hypothetical protein
MSGTELETSLPAYKLRSWIEAGFDVILTLILQATELDWEWLKCYHLTIA